MNLFAIVSQYVVFFILANNTNGAWLADGCERVGDNNDRSVTCHCNHLTNFGLIMNFDVIINPSQNSDKTHTDDSLKLVTFIGCFLSITGLGMTLITFLCFQ